MQSMWAGTLVFGLVEIPVRLGPATLPRELAFRQVHAEDGGRITFRRQCTACGADVSYADVAKAYQRADGDLVPLTDDDLATLPLEAAHRIEVRSFVPAGAIDPLLVSRSYFLAPADGPGRAYSVFHTALVRSGRIAVATITLRQREARAALWPRGPEGGSALVLQTLLAPDELTNPDLAAPNLAAPDLADTDPAPVDPDLPLAADLIAAMAADFDPAAHHDRYRDQLEALAHHKATNHPVNHTNPRSPSNPSNQISLTSLTSPTSTNVTDLTELLRASLATPRLPPGEHVTPPS